MLPSPSLHELTLLPGSRGYLRGARYRDTETLPLDRGEDRGSSATGVPGPPPERPVGLRDTNPGEPPQLRPLRPAVGTTPPTGPGSLADDQNRVTSPSSGHVPGPGCRQRPGWNKCTTAGLRRDLNTPCPGPCLRSARPPRGSHKDLEGRPDSGAGDAGQLPPTGPGPGTHHCGPAVPAPGGGDVGRAASGGPASWGQHDGLGHFQPHGRSPSRKRMSRPEPSHQGLHCIPTWPVSIGAVGSDQAGEEEPPLCCTQCHICSPAFCGPCGGGGWRKGFGQGHSLSVVCSRGSEVWGCGVSAVDHGPCEVESTLPLAPSSRPPP